MLMKQEISMFLCTVAYWVIPMASGAMSPRFSGCMLPQGPRTERSGSVAIIRGRVVDGPRGAPCAGARIVLFRQAPTSLWLAGEAVGTYSDESGAFELSFRIGGVDTGGYVVEVRPPGVNPGESAATARLGRLSVRVGGNQVTSDQEELVCTLDKGATLDVVVSNREGGLVDGAAVIVVPMDAAAPAHLLLPSLTSPAGRSAFEDVGRGDYYVLAYKAHIGVALAEPVRVAPGEKRSVPLRLEAGGDLYVETPYDKLRTKRGFGADMCEVRNEKGLLLSLGPLSPRLWGASSIDELAEYADGTGVFSGTYLPGRVSIVERRWTSAGDHLMIWEGKAQAAIERGKNSQAIISSEHLLERRSRGAAR
jgi:carboxypeptidase family protein